MPAWQSPYDQSAIAAIASLPEAGYIGAAGSKICTDVIR
jgi:hypothetical protein